MTFEEFEKATDDDLTRETKRCFDLYTGGTAGGGDRPALLLEAQFYMQELGRREDASVARRDLLLETVVIGLIGLEIVLGVYGIVLGIRQGKDEDALMTKQNGVLTQLNTNMASTAQTLQTSLATMNSMNNRLGVELGRMSQITLDFSIGAKTFLSNQGNVDLNYWGYKVQNSPAKMRRQSVSMRRGVSIGLPNFLNEIHKHQTSVKLQFFIRDDFNNEYVGEIETPGGPGIMNWAGRLEVVQRRWSPDRERNSSLDP